MPFRQFYFGNCIAKRTLSTSRCLGPLVLTNSLPSLPGCIHIHICMHMDTCTHIYTYVKIMRREEFGRENGTSDEEKEGGKGI